MVHEAPSHREPKPGTFSTTGRCRRHPCAAIAAGGMSVFSRPTCTTRPCFLITDVAGTIGGLRSESKTFIEEVQTPPRICEIANRKNNLTPISFSIREKSECGATIRSFRKIPHSSRQMKQENVRWSCLSPWRPTLRKFEIHFRKRFNASSAQVASIPCFALSAGRISISGRSISLIDPIKKADFVICRSSLHVAQSQQP